MVPTFPNIFLGRVLTFCTNSSQAWFNLHPHELHCLTTSSLLFISQIVFSVPNHFCISQNSPNNLRAGNTVNSSSSSGIISPVLTWERNHLHRFNYGFRMKM